LKQKITLWILNLIKFLNLKKKRKEQKLELDIFKLKYIVHKYRIILNSSARDKKKYTNLAFAQICMATSDPFLMMILYLRFSGRENIQ